MASCAARAVVAVSGAVRTAVSLSASTSKSAPLRALSRISSRAAGETRRRPASSACTQLSRTAAWCARDHAEVSTSSGNSPHAARLPDGPGTELAVAQQIPVDARSLWLHEALGEPFEQHPALLFSRWLIGDVASSGDRQFAHLSRAREPGRQMRCGRAQRASELWILGDLDAGMGCGHRASVPPVYRPFCKGFRYGPGWTRTSDLSIMSRQ